MSSGVGGVNDPRNHLCETPGCNAWGAYGFGAPGKTGGPLRWFCRKHRPEKTRPDAVRDKSGDQGGLFAGKQGSLF